MSTNTRNPLVRFVKAIALLFLIGIIDPTGLIFLGLMSYVVVKTAIKLFNDVFN